MGVRIAFPEVLGTVDSVRLVRIVGIVVSVASHVVGGGNDGVSVVDDVVAVVDDVGAIVYDAVAV